MRNQQTLVLSSLKSGNEKAVLNLQITGNEISGKIRLYNFSAKPVGILTLGILADGKVTKSALKDLGQNVYSFSTLCDCDLSKFTCALINVSGGVAKPLLLGASNGVKPKTMDFRLAENLYLLDEKDLSRKEIEQKLDSANIDYDDDEKEAIDRAISAELGGSDKCACCKYREAFFAGCERQNVETKTTERQVVLTDTTDDNINFYEEIKEQLDALFEHYPEETFLCEVIPNSKWIKVDYEDSGEYYVIGLIYENEKLKFISYGVPGQFDISPPRELSENAQWLPLDPDKPQDLGYWLTYQDAQNGETIEVNVS